ncbi:unnamed protein product [Rotaria sp. Silwood1]|nr:unnamed protein product [Rotaria sp. Silwood1]
MQLKVILLLSFIAITASWPARKNYNWDDEDSSFAERLVMRNFLGRLMHKRTIACACLPGPCDNYADSGFTTPGNIAACGPYPFDIGFNF